MTLSDLRPGASARVVKLLSGDDIRRRLLDVGLVEGTRVRCVGTGPFGDPSAYLIRGAVIAIRSQDGKRIIVESTEGADERRDEKT